MCIWCKHNYSSHSVSLINIILVVNYVLLLKVTDDVLGVDSEEQMETVDEWISGHHQRLRQAFQAARASTEKEALRRKERQKPTGNADLPIGARVFIRNHPLGRNKMQDYWKSTPHVVIAHPNPEGPVYVVEPLTGNGPTKTVHRTELLDSKELHKRELHPKMEPEVANEKSKTKVVTEDSLPQGGYFVKLRPRDMLDVTQVANNDNEDVVQPDVKEATPTALPKAGEQSPPPATVPSTDMTPSDISSTGDPSTEPPRRSRRLQGLPPVTEEVLTDLSKSYLLLMQLMAGQSSGVPEGPK